MLLDFGTEEQKQRHIPAILRGEEIWMQFLSEPSGGSDVAGALTTAVRDGDEWVLNGSKVWTTGAWWSDWGLCLARTNWDVPKHRGLTVFMLPIHQPGIEVHRIEMLNGTKEFCQEFLTDVRVPDSDRIGEVDDGWTVGTRWMFHERMLHNSPLVTLPAGDHAQRRRATPMLDVARDAGRLGRPRGPRPHRRGPDARGRGRARCKRRVGAGHRHRDALRPGVGDRPALRRASPPRAAPPSPSSSPGPAGAAWTDDDGDVGRLRHRLPDAPGRRASAAAPPRWPATCISERVLGMPRERSVDRDVAFRDVPRSAT